eukprot:CAMPEP_0194087102 /NCGR_PEP_ID=MMETSP0149-20130528/23840_1 /TAXON_ID=122233 /ORGANISM="Chaetoceros debilis, Strain MM31A-1" /LENGTH=277 /DNA_ID=CAMNT_0038770371 /DNA_START=111 /DNA_END=944 /DNA_ORIENTATION=-
MNEIASNTLAQLPSFSEHSTTIASTAVKINPLVSYKESLENNPLLTKMITGGTLAVCGDAIAQSQTDENYDKKRASSFALFDMVYRAVQHFSFPPIVANCHGQFIAGAIATVPGLTAVTQNMGWNDPYYFGAMEQTLASQLGIVPFFYYPVFYTVTALVQGLDTEAAIQRAKDTFVPLMKRNLLFWIPVQFIQFGFIDESLQIPFLSICGLAWTFIISVFAGNAKQTDERDQELVVSMNTASKGIVTSADIEVLEKEIIKAAERDLVTNSDERSLSR